MGLLKQQKLDHVIITNSNVMQVGGDLVIDKELYCELMAKCQNLKLFNRLIREKIALCKNSILNKDIQKLQEITNTIFNYGLNGIDNEQTQILYFYRFICALLEKNNDCMEDCIDNLVNGYQEEAKILSKFQKEPYHMEFHDYSNLSIEAQFVILDISFEEGLYAYIKELYLENVKENKEVSDILKYYCGLSMLNLHQYEDAHYILGCVNQLEKKTKIHLLQTLSLAQIEMIKYDREGTNGDELERIFHELGEIREKDVNALRGCELGMAMTELQIAIWLSPDRFIEIFESYGKNIQEDLNIQLLLGLYYESCNENEKAINIYRNADWKNNEIFLFRLLLGNLILGKYDEVLQVYESAYDRCKTAQSTGAWLNALKLQDVNKYYLAIREKAEQYKHNVEDMFYIILSVDNDKELFDDLFLNEILSKIDAIKSLDSQMKIGYASVLLRFEYAEWCFELLNSLDNVVLLDERIIFDFYEWLCKYKSVEIEAYEKNLPTGQIALYLENKVKICDWFIEHDFRSDIFLKEKINCLFMQKKKISMLSCSKQLYEITHEEYVAANIIALLLESEISSQNDYEYCIQALKDTKLPRSLIAIAAACKRIGKIKEAGFYSYKAIFLLNGEDDFEIYNGFLSLHNEMMYDYHHVTIDFEEVIGNTVITLRASGNYDGSNIIEYVCLDSELELEEMVSGNFSMGIKHLCSKDPKYLRLQNKKKEQSIVMDGKEYVIEEIINREVYALRYVLNKCTQNPDKCNIVTLSVKSDSIEDLWKQIKEVTHNYQGTEKKIINVDGEKDIRLDFYHFKNNTIGLPIDALIQKDYNNYIDVVRMLLYGKNQALYAGVINNDKITEHKTVVTLSSLVVMCQMGKLDLLRKLDNQIIIPLSLVEFLNVRTKKSIEMQAISPGTLIEMPDGTPAMLSFDETVVEMWNTIYEFCLSFEKVEITDQERLEFNIMEEISSDILFSSLEIDKMQMDCMILAKQRDAIYLCDDLFLREVATAAGIKNTNFTSLIYLLEDKQEATKICMELSMTNYIYVPFIYVNMKEAREMWGNLLSSDRKRKYYGPMIDKLLSNVKI